MPNERQTDFLIADLLRTAGIKFFPNGSEVFEIKSALATASKRGTNRTGFPEFTAVVEDFVIVVEDKADTKFQAAYLGGDKKVLLMDTKSITNYAENGALHYALKIIDGTRFRKVIAFGCSGVDEKRILIRPIFVTPNGYKVMAYEKDFSKFTAERIGHYYKEKILEHKPLEQVELEDIISHSRELHEDLRNFGNLSDAEKPLVVSGIMLALRNENFNTELLSDENRADGFKICDAISNTLDGLEVEPLVKKSRLLDQFDLIKNRPYLSQFNEHLAKSPLKYFAEYIDSNVITAIVNNSPEDVLGRFYSEFIRYSGGAGQTLGVVLTPRHIAELFCDLADFKADDKVFDPCCGTATFLIAAMNKLLELAKDDEDKKRSIKKNQLHGIELRDDMFSIATTNMILRGDGKSNLLCEDFLKIPAEELRKKNFTVGFMNPPYSQAKTKVTAHLSELKFISHLLDSLADGARCIVIVPQSTMVGKTSDDKLEKKYILDNHTLEGVITLNPQTFYGVGTNPVIAVFTAHKPHPADHYVKFVDFKDDGYEVFPHIGLLPTSRAPERKKLLIQCFVGNRIPPKSFMLTTPIKYTDEWLHSFYYFNEEIPDEKDFEKTMADYLSFEFSMIVHGRGYLFEGEKKNSPLTAEPPPLESKTWKDFFIGEIANIIAGKNINAEKRIGGNIPYISSSANNNGVTCFVGNENETLEKNCISVNSNGSIGYAFFHPYAALYSGDCKKLRLHVKNKYASIFVAHQITARRGKYSYGYKFNSARMKREKILLPVDEGGNPDWIYMEIFMRRIEEKLLTLYKNYIVARLNDNAIVPAKPKAWKDFFIGEIFKIKSGVRLTKDNMHAGNIPFVGASDSNNGITAWVANKNMSLDKNVLGVNYNGSVVESFYHPYEAIFSDDVKRFHLKEHANDKYILLFIKNAILQQKQKFQYGYKFNAGRMESQKIMLPVDEDGNPDWEYMEKFMRAQENLLLRRYFEILSNQFELGE